MKPGGSYACERYLSAGRTADWGAQLWQFDMHCLWGWGLTSHGCFVAVAWCIEYTEAKPSPGNMGFYCTALHSGTPHTAASASIVLPSLWPHFHWASSGFPCFLPVFFLSIAFPILSHTRLSLVRPLPTCSCVVHFLEGQGLHIAVVVTFRCVLKLPRGLVRTQISGPHLASAYGLSGSGRWSLRIWILINFRWFDGKGEF